MKLDIGTMLKELGLPVALLALFAAVLGLFGVSLDVILAIVESLAGTFTLIALGINVLKWCGVVSNGTSGKWSAVANLLVLLAVAIVFRLYPQFDFNGVDMQIGEFAKVGGLVFAYIVQVVGSKQVHIGLTRGLNIKAFSFSGYLF